MAVIETTKQNPIGDARSKYLKNTFLSDMTPQEAEKTINFYQSDPDRIARTYRSDEAYDGLKRQKVLESSAKYPKMNELIGDLPSSVLTTEYIDDVTLIAKKDKEYNDILQQIKESDVGLMGTVADFYERRNLEEERGKHSVLSQREGLTDEEIQAEYDIINLINKRLDAIPNPTKDTFSFNTAKGIGDLAASSDKALVSGGTLGLINPALGLFAMGVVLTDESNYRFAGRYLRENPNATAEEALKAVQIPAVIDAGIEMALTAGGAGILGVFSKTLNNVIGKGGGGILSKTLGKSKIGGKITNWMDKTWSGKISTSIAAGVGGELLLEEKAQQLNEEAFFETYKGDKSHLVATLNYLGADVANLFSGEGLNERNKEIFEMIRTTGGAIAIISAIGGGFDKVSSNSSDWIKDKQKSFNERLQNNEKFKKALGDFKTTIDGTKAPDVFKKQMMQELTKDGKTYLTAQKILDLKALAESKLSAEKLERFNKAYAAFAEEQNIDSKLESGEKIDTPIADFIEMFGLDEELYQSALDGSSPTQSTESSEELKAEKTSSWNTESELEQYAKITDSIINMDRFKNFTEDEKASVSGAMQIQFESLKKVLKDGQDLTTESFIETYIPTFNEKEGDGRAVFNRAENQISLYEKGDISSILHENQHSFFSTVERAYFQDNLNDDYRSVYEDIRESLGETELKQPLSSDGQEKLSDMFEKYMTTGVAPNNSLQKIFSDIKNLMLKIYATANAVTGLRISPEVKTYFDSMFAAELQVRTAENNSRLSPLSKPASMTNEEYQDYLLTVDSARTDESIITRKDSEKRESMKNTEGMQNYKETQKNEFISKLSEQSVYKAQVMMLTEKVNSKYIEENNIENVSGAYVSENGKIGTNLELDIDTISGSLGYASSLEMITDATSIDTLEQSADNFANEQVDIKIDEKLGVLHQDIPYLSQSNKYRLKQLVIESGSKNVEVRMKEIISSVNNYMNKVSSKDSSDYKSTYDTFVKKNDQARAAYLRGDIELSSKLFEEAAYNSVLMEAKKEARNNLEKLSDKINFLKDAKSVTINKIGEENHNFLIDLLYNWRFITNNSGTGLTIDEQVDNWVDRIPSGMFFDKKMVSQNKEFLVNGTLKQYRDTEKQIENMRYKDAEFFGILIDGIEQTSRVDVSLKAINLDETKGALREAAMEEFMAKKGKVVKVTTEKQKLGWLKQFYAGQLDSTETFFNNLFGEKVAMLYVRPYFRSLENAENEFAEIKKTMGEIYTKHGKDKGGLTVDRKLMIPELGMAISEQTMLEIALNNGNSFNRDNMKVTLKQQVEAEQGRVLNITEESYSSILDQIDKVYFDIAEDFSKLLGGYWQSTKDNYRKLTGNELTAVLGEEFSVHGKTYSGWYYPATKIDIRPHAEMESVLGAEDMMKSLINASHLNERSGAITGNLDLTNANLMKHLHNVVLFKYVAEPYRDLSNFLKESKGDISSVAGDFRYNSMVKWFNNSLKPDSIDTPLFSQMEKIYKMAILSWKYSTALIQLTAFVGAAPQVGMRNLRKAAIKQLTNPAEFNFNAIATKSPALKARWEHIEEAAFDMIHNPHKTKQSKYDIFMRAGFFPLAYLDLIAANIAWEAANYQAKEELLYNTEEASLYADSVMRTSQGDFSYYSKPEIAKGWSRLFVPFMTYFLASGSNLRAAYADKNVMKVGSYLIALGIIVPLLESVIKEPLKDDDDEFTLTESWLDNSVATMTTALVPIPMISKLPINAFKTIIGVVNPDINVKKRYYSNEIPLQKAMEKASRGIDAALESGLNKAGFKTKKSAAENAFKSLSNFGDIGLPNELMREMVKPYFKDLTD